MKVVQYILPFQSLDGTNYEVRIYGENDLRPVKTLIGSASPFETSEDASEDYFEPVRVQTAGIHIINDNGLLTLGELLPRNDTDRPVRLVRVSDETVEWQGFLTCETYSQEYTARPHEIDLNAQSVLGALGSVNMPTELTDWTKRIRTVVSTAILATDNETGMNMMRDIYYDNDSKKAFDKYIDYTKLLSEKEQVNENNITWEIEAVPAKDVLDYVCRMMGYVCREIGQDIYMFPSDRVVYARKQSIKSFASAILGEAVTSTDVYMSDLTYKGVGHNINTRAGARSVEVVTKLDKYNLDLSIPPCPVGSLHEIYEPIYRDYLYALLNTNDNYYAGKNEYAYYKCLLSPQMGTASDYSTTTREDVFDNLLIIAKKDSPAYRNVWESGTSKEFRAGAMLAKITFDDGNQEYHETQDGLYLSLFPGMIADEDNTPQYDQSQVGPIYTMHTLLPVNYKGGYITIDANAIFIGATADDPWWGDHGNAGAREPFGGHRDRSPEAMCCMLRIGDKYWNGEEWVNEETTFVFDFDENGGIEGSKYKDKYKDESGYVAPLPTGEVVQGQVWFYIYPNAGYIKDSVGTFGYGRYASEMFFTKLDINYKVKNEKTLTDRSENTYYRLLGLKFKEDVQVSTELGTSLNNLPSPSLILNTHNGYYGAETIQYEQGTMRPEHKLLSRLAKYYGKARTIVTLEVEPMDVPLPMVRLTGYDGKTYLPLSENRDWRTGVSTIQCWEMPE